MDKWRSLALAHSNSESEHIFSIVTDVKTKKKKTNRLNSNTLNSIAVIRSSFQDKKSSCVDFKVTCAHLD